MPPNPKFKVPTKTTEHMSQSSQGKSDSSETSEPSSPTLLQSTENKVLSPKERSPPKTSKSVGGRTAEKSTIETNKRKKKGEGKPLEDPPNSQSNSQKPKPKRRAKSTADGQTPKKRRLGKEKSDWNKSSPIEAKENVPVNSATNEDKPAESAHQRPDLIHLNARLNDSPDLFEVHNSDFEDNDEPVVLCIKSLNSISGDEKSNSHQTLSGDSSLFQLTAVKEEPVPPESPILKFLSESFMEKSLSSIADPLNESQDIPDTVPIQEGVSNSSLTLDIQTDNNTVMTEIFSTNEEELCSTSSQKLLANQTDLSGMSMDLSNAIQETLPSTSGQTVISQVILNAPGVEENESSVPSTSSQTTNSDSLFKKPAVPKFKPSNSVNEKDLSKEDGGEKLSQSSQEYVLSQPSPELSKKERLLWLQEKRAAMGLWVQCNQCEKWRYLAEHHDPITVPELWLCSMNTDENYNQCQIPEKRLSLLAEEDMIFNKFSPGSIVWVRLEGYPWWPAMVDDDPDFEAFYWLNEFSDIPTWYHVVFFDNVSKITRGWIQTERIFKFTGKEKFSVEIGNNNYGDRIAAARQKALKALSLPILGRLRQYGFAATYNGKFGSA